MKFAVLFKELKKTCCPPKNYWSIIDTVIVAEDVDQAIEKIKKGRIKVEIKSIKKID